MREIKFRGKHLVTGKWIYGNYMEKIKPTEKENVFWCCFIQDRALSMDEVDRNTIGQFTGVKDWDGDNIYEGDVIDIAGIEGVCTISFDFLTWNVTSMDAITPLNDIPSEDIGCIRGDIYNGIRGVPFK